MTLVFIAKDMDVANPVGVVNINPLPSLPGGLGRAHLMRLSLSQTQLNLVDGQATALNEFVAEGGAISYTDISASAEPRRSGWFDASWKPDFNTGFTWMQVMDMQDPAYASATGIGLAEPTDAGSSNPTPIALVHRTNAVYLQFRSAEEENIEVFAGAAGHDGKPVLSFGAIGPGDDAAVYVPHRQAAENETVSYMGTIAGLGRGTSIGSYYGSPNDADGHRRYMVAYWGRVLSQAEMASAYTALKPWLLARGVEIA